MIRIRSGRGLGDSIYLRAIVGYLVARGDTVTALSDYPDIFAGSGAKVEPFTRAGANIRVAHYTLTMQDQSMTQYAAMRMSWWWWRGGVVRLPEFLASRGYKQRVSRPFSGSALLARR